MRADGGAFPRLGEVRAAARPWRRSGIMSMAAQCHPERRYSAPAPPLQHPRSPQNQPPYIISETQFSDIFDFDFVFECSNLSCCLFFF